MDKDLIVFAVAIWWRNKRPLEWTLEKHLENPSVNCIGPHEKEMAIRYAELLTNTKRGNTMAKDKDGKKKDKGEKKDKKGKEIEKAPVIETETKKDKKDKKKDKKAKGVDVTTPNDTRPTDEMIAAVTPAKIVKTIEDALKLDTTPAGDYVLRTPSGLVRARKSEGAGKVSWQLDNERITRSTLYNITKSGKTKAEFEAKTDDAANKLNQEETGKDETKKDKKGKKDKKAGKSTDPIHDDSDGNGPDAAKLAGVYKKKQLLNILKAGQLFKKKIIKAVEAEIAVKKLTGSEFIAALDTATGSETPVDKINAIFADL